MTASPPLADRPARILVVDDERDNRELLDIILTWEGFVVLTAASGEEALASVAEQPPDLILLDIMMPGMNGYQVATTIRGSAATKNVSIIMLSALADLNARTLGLSAGADDFIAKPLDRAELVLRVKEILRLGH